MCRWMAWHGQDMLIEELLLKPKHSLIDQSLHSRMGAETTNGDGLGLGWYGTGKAGLNHLTRQLAMELAPAVRVNAISPGGVFAGQPDEFTTRLHRLIPMGRMAHKDEYQGAILFLCSDASSYMTGQNLIVDGGRSVL